MSQTPIYKRCAGCGHSVESPCVGPQARSACPRFNGARMVSSQGSPYPGPFDPETEWPKDALGQPWVGEPVQADEGINPKDILGELKVDLSLVPPVALIHEAHSMVDGAIKYGPFNWRDKRVRARVYIAAALRHIGQYADGEDIDPDSGAHHLGHARSCLGIILDATASDSLVDDRPLPGRAGDTLRRLKKEAPDEDHG